MMTSNKRTKYNAHVIVTSDTCFKDTTRDTSGTYVVDRLKRMAFFLDVKKTIVSDDFNRITGCIKKTLVDHDPALIITVGGTGLCPRDVTPEATSSLYDKHCTGIVTALHMTSLRYTPMAALSRLTAGIIGGCLVVNFPGSEMACLQSFGCLDSFIEHAINQVRSDLEMVRKTHQNMKANQQSKINNSNYRRWYPNNKKNPNKNGPNNPQNAIEVAPNKNPNQSKPTDNKIVINDKTLNQMAQSKSHPQVDKQDDLKTNDHPMELRQQVAAKITDTKATQVATSLRVKSNSNVAARSYLDEVLVPCRSRMAIGFGPLQTRPTKTPVKIDTGDVQPTSNAGDDKLESSIHSGESPKVVSEQSVVRPLLRESPYPKVHYEDALAKMQKYSQYLLNTNVVVEYELTKQTTANRSLYHVLAEDLRPKRLVPAYSASTMDGYVVNTPTSMLKTFNLVSRVHATVVKDLNELERIRSNQEMETNFYCYQVNTGGRLPDANFVIVPTEKAELLTRNKVVLHELKRGAYVRPAGSDMNENDVIEKGTIIGPVELSLILLMGHKKVKTWRRPRIGIMSTGDELVSAYDPNGGDNPDSVTDVNSPLLTTVLGFYRYPVTQLGIVKDDPNEIASKLKFAIENCDVVLITGGASMGSKDWVKHVLEENFKAKMHFGRVNIKPGKPAAFATIEQGDKLIPIFSLPGNPVSAYVTSLVLVLPFLEHGLKRQLCPEVPLDLKLMGDIIPVVIQKLLDGDEGYEFDGRLEFARAKVVGPPATDRGHYPVSVSVKQQSSRLLCLKDFDCMIMVSPNRIGSRFQVGDTYWACKLKRTL